MALSLSAHFNRALFGFAAPRPEPATATSGLFTGLTHDLGVRTRLLEMRLEQAGMDTVERELLADIAQARESADIPTEHFVKAYSWLVDSHGTLGVLANRPAVVQALLGLMIEKNCRHGLGQMVDRHGPYLQTLAGDELRVRMAAYVSSCAQDYISARVQPDGKGHITAADGLYKLLCACDGPEAGKNFVTQLTAALQRAGEWKRLCEDLCGVRAHAPADMFIDAEHTATLGAAFVREPQVPTPILNKYVSLFAEHLVRVPEPMRAARREVLPDMLAGIRHAARDGEMDVAVNYARALRQRLQLDETELRHALNGIVDDLLAEKKAANATSFIMQTDSLENTGLLETMTTDRALRLAQGLAITGDMKMIMFWRKLLDVNPAAAAAIDAEVDVMRDIDGPRILAGLAPIVTMDNNAAYDLAAVIHLVPHRAMGMAQADALQDVWQALETADPDIPAMPELQRLRPGEPLVEILQGRPDIPFRAEELHKLSCDVSRLLNVVQTQVPIIAADSASVDRLLDRVVTDHDEFSGSRMEASATFVNGSATNVSVAENDERLKSRFGFIIVNKEEKQDVDGVTVAQRKLVGMPVITIDDGILTRTMQNGGEAMLRHLQMVGGIFNHDYFHHFTARIINPYFGMFRVNALEIQNTPYGVMMGAARETPVTRPDSENTVTSLGIEQTARFNREQYDEPRWKEFNRVNTYEFHAMHLHNVLYQRYMDGGDTGQRLRDHVTGYMDELAALGGRLQEAGVKGREIDTLKIYYANLMGFHLLRLVPFGHPVMQMLEDKVESLGIDKRRLQQFVERVLPDQEYSGYDSTLKRLNQRTGLDPARVIHPDKLSPAECVRACAFFAAERVLNPMYNPRYEEARGYALSALRQSVSVVQRDMKVVEIRGGEEVALKMMAARQRRTDGLGPRPLPV